LLLADAVTRSRNAALSVGSAGIFVDAKNADAVRFYKRYGFIACHEQPYKLEADFRMFPGLTMENWVDN